MMRQSSTLTLLSLLASGVLLTPLAHAETIVQKRINSTHRFIPLEKITVGPDDQYDASLAPAQQRLIFTHKADLVANLQTMDLKTGEVKDLLPVNADSQEASVGPGGRLAFTYFKANARGDVCWTALPQELKSIDEKAIHCLTRAASEGAFQRSNPFWKSENEIGFLERDINSQSSRVVIANLASGEQKTIAEGRIWAPSMAPGGRFLAYNELVTESGSATRRITVLDLTSGKATTLHFALPGLSGFPAFSMDETYLYFSHYLNDTNNDRSIDGEDNAVVFRVPLAEALRTPQDILPEQLTSAEASCSFPRPGPEAVYVTCAFEGSLDAYSMPLTGVVPRDWDQSRLTNALQTSRSYQDRILLLNALRLHAEKNQQIVYRSIDDRFLSTHIFSDDTVAARYYLKRLQASSEPRDRAFYDLLGLYLRARELKKAQPSSGISREFQRRMVEFETQATRIKGEPRFLAITRGLFKTFTGQSKAAEAFLKQARFDQKKRPLERFFYFELANSIYGPSLPKSWPRHLEIYRQMMAAPELTEESQIYYAVTFLDQLKTTEPSREKRLALIEKANRGLPEAVATLLKSEAVTMRIIMAGEDSEKLKIYREMDQLMSKTRDDYFLRKALYTRSVVNFADAAQFKYMTLIATNWLRYTKADDTEFIYAREAFSNSALDQAYDNLAKNKLDFAGNFFYESLSLTDDLESHAGYIRTMIAKGQRKTLDDRYLNLQKRQFVEDNMKFVEALLVLMDNESEARKNPALVRHLDEAIEKLEAMIQDRDSATRYLLLGYCYMEKMLRTASGLDFDSDLFQKAHRSLMLSYDLGRDNNRIRASALMNLGILHQRVQNPGLSAKFLALRKSLGFSSQEERARIEALYARSLARSHQSERAAIELASLAEPLRSAPLLEREAFYSMTAGRYAKANELYSRLLKTNAVSGDENLGKVYLANGFVLLKLKRASEAKTSLEQALPHIARLSKIPAGGDRMVEFDPDRLRLAALGFLAQAGSASNSQANTRTDRIASLEKRLELLKSSKDRVDDWESKVILTYNQLADLHSPSEPGKAAELMRQALEWTDSYTDSNPAFGSTAFRATANYLAHGLLYPQAYGGANGDLIQKLMEKSLKAYDQQKVAQPLLDYQRLKLEILWAVYATRVLGKPVSAPHDLDSLLNSSRSQSLKESLPAQWAELQALASNLRIK